MLLLQTAYVMGRDARDSKKGLEWKALNNQGTSIPGDTKADTKTHTAFTGQGGHCRLSLPLRDIYLAILSQELQILYHRKWGA